MFGSFSDIKKRNNTTSKTIDRKNGMDGTVYIDHTKKEFYIESDTYEYDKVIINNEY